MKEIRLQISDKAFEKIRGEIGLKHPCGQVHGSLDEFIILILKAIENKNKRAIVQATGEAKKRQLK